jgi:probable phosphoglycerate mutase
MQSLAMEEVYLVRHGETEWNLTGRRQGQLDSPLSESGMMEVQRTAKRIESLPDVAPFAVEVQRWSQLIQAAA